MNLEEYNRLGEALEIPSQGTVSPYRELLEKMFEVFIRLESESVLGMNYDHRAGQNGSYTNCFKSDGIPKTSGTLNRLVSDIPNTADTPRYPSTFKRGQRSSEILLNAAAECYLEGVSTRDSGKIFDQFWKLTKKRFKEEEGESGLEDRSSRPHTHPNATPPKKVKVIITLRKEGKITGI